MGLGKISDIKHFNSHAHVERDQLTKIYFAYCIISTHTLTWSVTCQGHYPCISKHHFNSHAHVERDDFLWNADETKFHFNSHAHVERDPFPLPLCPLYPISTHTLTWSVTLDVVYIWCLLNVMRTYFFI